MKSMLYELYCNNLMPSEQYYPKSKKYRKVREKNHQRYEQFEKNLEKLDPSLDKELEEIIDDNLETISLEMSSMFIGGFKLGARIMTEVFSDDES